MKRQIHFHAHPPIPWLCHKSTAESNGMYKEGSGTQLSQT